ncbi:MAG: hypothetical protein ABIE68_02655 [bacterium]
MKPNILKQGKQNKFVKTNLVKPAGFPVMNIMMCSEPHISSSDKKHFPNSAAPSIKNSLGLPDILSPIEK